MADPIKPIQEIRYTTYLKKTIVQALQPLFDAHPDDTTLKDTKVTLDTPRTELQYPCVVVRFYERDFKSIGVGHSENIETLDVNGDLTGRYHKRKHYIYHGDIEFSIYALTSMDRDLIGDMIVQAVTMSETEVYSRTFLDRIYRFNEATAPGSTDHYVNINTDSIQGFGESQTPAPWGPEDTLVYTKAYRTNVSGEVYSRGVTGFDYGLVERVLQYPYMTGIDSVPDPLGTGPDKVPNTADDAPDPGPWI